MPTDPTAEIQDLLDRLGAERGQVGLDRARAVDELVGWWQRSAGLVEPIVDQWLRAAIAAQGTRGWRRVDVERAMTVKAPKQQADLVVSLRNEGVGPWRIRHGLGAAAAISHVVGARRLLGWLGTIPFVTDGAADDTDGVDPAVLAKVRALLAKAESTTFEAEAEALMAKAHQLMVRHAIDGAALDGHGPGGAVVARRVFIDDPYQRAKYLLLAEVARASSCRALLSSAFGFATVFGHAADVEAVDLLYTSLLLQATTGVVTARPTGAGRSASAIAAYRRAWLVAFGQRIGERLRQASQAAVHEAVGHYGDSLLPVLARREQAVEAAMRDAAPRVRSLRTSVSSGEGWLAGAAAGDRATLASQAPLPRRPGALGRG